MGAFEIGLFLFGLVLGPLINYSIYSFAYFPRPFSPWHASPQGLAERTWIARLPIVGWLFRTHESQVFGPFFWLRPFLIEIATPFLLLLLYRYVMAGNVSPAWVPSQTLFHLFMAYGLLIALMTVATFIDFDERTIPDWITVPGTILGLVGAVVFPDWRLLEMSEPIFPALVGTPVSVQANSPYMWEGAWSVGAPRDLGLWLGILFWSGWCFGMADRRWIMRRGLKKAFVYFAEALKRSPSSRLLLTLWCVGLVCLVGAYWTIGALRWEALLSSLFGIGLGGLLVWGFRLVARWAMGQEALGFGDVTLMAMIGSFFGWQIVWIAFFLAPFFGLIFVLILWAITRDNATPFGPYLCAATLYAMLDWVNLWQWASVLFLPPLMILPILVCLLLALGAMLWLIVTIKMKLLGLELNGTKP